MNLRLAMILLLLLLFTSCGRDRDRNPDREQEYRNRELTHKARMLDLEYLRELQNLRPHERAEKYPKGLEKTYARLDSLLQDHLFRINMIYY